jgi:hypothetical protein
LAAGTVPIYLGAKNINLFDPGYAYNKTSLINAKDFKDVASLAQYIKQVASNETLYNQYLEWKQLPPSKVFRQLVDWSLDYEMTPCRICKHVAMVKELKQKANSNQS